MSLHTHVHVDTHTYMGVHAHARTCTHPRILSSCCQRFNVLIFKFEAPTGCLERLVQPVCLGAILFISLLVTSKSSVFLAGCVRVVECFGFWLQLVNFSESVDPGVRWEVFSQRKKFPGEPWGPPRNFRVLCMCERLPISEKLWVRGGGGRACVHCLPSDTESGKDFGSRIL